MIAARVDQHRMHEGPTAVGDHAGGDRGRAGGLRVHVHNLAQRAVLERELTRQALPFEQLPVLLAQARVFLVHRRQPADLLGQAARGSDRFAHHRQDRRHRVGDAHVDEADEADVGAAQQQERDRDAEQ
jgi:hypothetical protein